MPDAASTLEVKVAAVLAHQSAYAGSKSDVWVLRMTVLQQAQHK
jgi:hypothetical protein